MDLEAGQAAPGPSRQRGVHRKLHQFAHLRSARRRVHYEGPQSEPERAHDGGAGLAAGEAAGGSRRARQNLPRGRRDFREAGCSMCIAMNGDQLQPGEYSVSTSNRNFEGRQGKGGRTFLASPLTAAASAITGVVTDVRRLIMKFDTLESKTVVLPDRQHRYRPDHPRALSQDHFERRSGRQGCFSTGATTPTARRTRSFHPEQAGQPKARRFCWPAITSAAAVRASTRRGR